MQSTIFSKHRRIKLAIGFFIIGGFFLIGSNVRVLAAPSVGSNALYGVGQYLLSLFVDPGSKDPDRPQPSPMFEGEISEKGLFDENIDSALPCTTTGVTINVPLGGSIQTAINAANPLGGDTIGLAAGTYTEQIVVNKCVQIVGAGTGVTFIQSPATLSASTISGVQNTFSIVEIRSNSYVTMEDLTVAGPVPFMPPGPGNPTSTYGIFIAENGTLDFEDGRVATIWKSGGLDGVQDGTAIGVGRAAYNNIGELITNNVVVENYQKNGIVVGLAGSSATLNNTTVNGVGPTPLIAQNGIQIAAGANAAITNSTVTGNAYLPPPPPAIQWVSTGILVFDAGLVSITDSILSNNDVSVYHFFNTTNSGPFTVARNTITNGQYGVIADGINAEIRENFISNNGFGVAAWPQNTNTVSVQSNSITGSATNGIYFNEYSGIVTLANLDVNFNRISGNTVGLENASDSAVDAENNFWGCNGGPLGGVGCDTTGGTGVGLIDADPWLQVTGITATPDSLNYSGNSTVTGGSLRINSDLQDTFLLPGTPSVIDGIPFTFSVGPGTNGSILPGGGVTAAGLLVGSTTFTATVGPVNGNQIETVSANIDSASSSDDITILDTTAPTTTLTYLGVDPTNTTLQFSVTFSEPVSGFVSGDVSVTNGTVANFAGSGANYTFDINATTSGPVGVEILAGVAQDAAANGNLASNQITVTYDGISPTVTILRAGPTSSTAPVSFTATFSETVTGFDASDISFAGSTTGGFLAATVTPVGPLSYTVQVSGMSTSGNVVISVPAGAVIDTASNPNTASTPASPGSDSIDFTVDNTDVVLLPSNAAANEWAYYNDDTNTVLTTYDFVYGPGTPPLQVGSARIQTGAAPPNSRLALGTVAFNGTRFDQITNLTYESYFVGGTSSVPTLQFNVDLDLTDSDVSYQGRMVYVPPTPVAHGWQQWDALQGTWGISPLYSSLSPCTLSAPCTRAQLLAAHPNIGIHSTLGFLLFRVEPNSNSNVDNFIVGVSSENSTFDFEPSIPTVTVSYTGPDPTNSAAVNFTVQFSEPVTGFDNAGTDVIVGGSVGGTASMTAIDADTYTVTITGANGTGTLDVSVPAAAAQGSTSSAPNTASNTASVGFDNVAPVPTLTADLPASSTSPVTFTVNFSEPVTDFAAADIDLSASTTGGTLVAVVSGSGSGPYVVSVTGMNGSGNVVATVVAGAVLDAAGNTNSATSTDTTVFTVVNSNVVVSPANLQSWVRANASTGNSSFVTGPGTPPLQIGSARMITGPGTAPSTGGRAWISRQVPTLGIPLSSITELSYSTYITSRVAGSSVAPSLRLRVTLTGVTSQTVTMVYEPVYSGTTLTGQWQTWNARAGRWWFADPSFFYSIPGGLCTAGTAGAGCQTFQQILNLYPNARIIDAAGGSPAAARHGIMFNVGQGGFGNPWVNFDGNIDDFVFGVDSSNTTYDFEPTPPTVSIADATPVAENAGPAVFAVSIDQVSQLPTTVTFNTSDGSATTADNDYAAVVNQTVTIPAGQLSVNVPVTINDDNVYENDETFTATITDAVNSVIGTPTATGTILNDEALPTVSISTTSTGSETGPTPNVFTVTLSGPSAFAVTVDYATADGTATTTGCPGPSASCDYVATSGTITFPANTLTLSQNINVATLADLTPEPTENFAINLSNPTVATIGTGTAVGEIADSGSFVSISGNVQDFLDPGFIGLPNVTVTLAGSVSQTTTTDASGNYTFNVGLPSGGSYLITPSCPVNPGCTGRVFDANSRNFDTLTSNASNVNFIAYQPDEIPREIRPQTSYGTPGTNVIVPILVESQGNERDFSFTIDYNMAHLTGPTVACGSGAGSCSLTLNNGTPGKLGILVEPAAVMTAGTQELVLVTFSIPLSVTVSNTPLSFSDTPTPLSTSDELTNPLATRYTAGTVVFAVGIECDVAGAPTGNGVILVNDVNRMRDFAAGLITPNLLFNEYQRADCAPSSTRGGGGPINTGDVNQTRAYAAGSGTPNPAGGPFSPFGSLQADLKAASEFNVLKDSSMGSATVNIVSQTGTPGFSVIVPIRMDLQGDENGVQFTVVFDPAVLSSPTVALAPGMPGGTGLTVNATQVASGRIGMVVDSGPNPFGTGSIDIVRITFQVNALAPIGPTPLTFSSTPTFQFVSDLANEEVPTTWNNGQVNILGTTSAAVSVSGRVTNAFGNGIPNAIVTMTDSSGAPLNVRTSSFGFFTINGVQAGRTYLLGASSKGYTFEMQTINVVDEITGLSLVANKQ